MGKYLLWGAGGYLGIGVLFQRMKELEALPQLPGATGPAPSAPLNIVYAWPLYILAMAGVGG